MTEKLAFIFPGQGAQYVGMGKDLYDNFEEAKKVFDEADAYLEYKLSDIMFNGPIETLTETKYCQLALYVASMATLKVIERRIKGIKPLVCAGLSLGEYSAATAAGLISFQTGLELVKIRGENMHKACEESKGTMAVIMGLTGDQVIEMVSSLDMPDELFTANLNSPTQTVISGTLKGVESGIAKAKEIGAKRAIPLQVHGAFHSGLMKSAEEALDETIKNATIQDSDVSLILNVTGKAASNAKEVRLLLTKQVTQSVRWADSVIAMEKMEIDLYIEIGCGSVLSGLNKRNGVKNETISVENSQGIDQLKNKLSDLKIEGGSQSE